MITQNSINLLLIEDEEFDVNRVEKTIKLFSDRIRICDVVSTGEDAIDLIKGHRDKYDIVIMDYQISGSVYGEPLVKELKKLSPFIQIIIITKMTVNQTNLNFATSLLQSGAFWFGTKYPGDIEDYIYQPTDFILSILNAYERKQLEMDSVRNQKKLDRNAQTIIESQPIIGQTTLMAEMKSLIDKFSRINANVLITGESGTGKELVATHIHFLSNRKSENFIRVNCAAIPGELIESELFGFEKGSFTGAREARRGLFEQANGGTILLDEIGELPLAAQAKLLRVLQDGEIDKIGRSKNYRVDVRVIAATNKELETLMIKKKFREDLYYRLNILQIHVPPLKDRVDDIPLLIQYFMNHYSQDFGVTTPIISDAAYKSLKDYSWPGNIRQLRNVTQKILLMSPGIVEEDLVHTILKKLSRPETFIPAEITSDNIVPLKKIEFEFRRKYVAFVRARSKNDVDAAKKLGIAPPNFHRLCKDLGLK